MKLIPEAEDFFNQSYHAAIRGRRRSEELLPGDLSVLAVQVAGTRLDTALSSRSDPLLTTRGCATLPSDPTVSNICRFSSKPALLQKGINPQNADFPQHLR